MNKSMAGAWYQSAVRWLQVLLLTGFVTPTFAGETITYFHNDVPGSPALASDGNGVIIWRENYRPYGDRLVQSSAAANNQLWFTGKPQEASTGLQYFGARYYDPTLGRFMGMDPAAIDPSQLHSLNRYAYGNNNPLTFVDPDGRKGKIAWLLRLTETGMQKVAKLTKEQAIAARRAGKNIGTERRQVAHEIETAADNGGGNVLKHGGHELKDGSKGLPHYQTEGRLGHAFWGVLSVAALAVADGLDTAAEAADVVDPTAYLTSGDTGELENFERTWFGAYKKIDPNGIDFIEANRRAEEKRRAEQERQDKEE